MISGQQLSGLLLKYGETPGPDRKELPATTVTTMTNLLVNRKIVNPDLQLNSRTNTTALYIAASHGYTQIVDLLAEYGSDVNYGGDSRITPLMKICQTLITLQYNRRRGIVLNQKISTEEVYA
jgi:hypothetical protein